MARIYQRNDLVQGGDEQIDTVKTLRIVYRDVFNLKYFYLLTHEWFIDNEFVTTRNDEDFPEVMFVHRNFASDSQIWWRWRFEKPSKDSPLFRWRIDLDVHILGYKQVETVVNGQKMKVDSAEVEVFVVPALYITKGQWKKNAITDFLTPMLRRIIYRKRVDKEKKLFENMVWRTQEALKTYFKLETYLPERQLHEFHQKMDMT